MDVDAVSPRLEPRPHDRNERVRDGFEILAAHGKGGDHFDACASLVARFPDVGFAAIDHDIDVAMLAGHLVEKVFAMRLYSAGHIGNTAQADNTDLHEKFLADRNTPAGQNAAVPLKNMSQRRAFSSDTQETSTAIPPHQGRSVALAVGHDLREWCLENRLHHGSGPP